jgi:hypothetical protein
MYVKISVNDLILLKFLKQAVDVFVQCREFKVSQRIAIEIREYLEYNRPDISVPDTFCIESM